ncbi:MAG: hypothetical protein OHK0037_37810 [Elainellaceae cyanobacterium]
MESWDWTSDKNRDGGKGRKTGASGGCAARKWRVAESSVFKNSEVLDARSHFWKMPNFLQSPVVTALWRDEEYMLYPFHIR